MLSHGDNPDRLGYHTLILHGESCIRKTDMAISFGQRIYWHGIINLTKWDEDAMYVMLDNLNAFSPPNWLGIIDYQDKIEIINKHYRKQTVHGKLIIILSNI